MTPSTAEPAQETFELADAQLLASPVTLPCGRVLPNRFVKVALYEHLAAFGGGPPNGHHRALYARWAAGGWGMLITGNCQVSPEHLSLGRDMTLVAAPPDASLASATASARTLEAFGALARAMRGRAGKEVTTKPGDVPDGPAPLAILQLSHCGRQSPRVVGGRLWTPHRRPLCPSARGVGDDSRDGMLAKLAYRALFPRPRVVQPEEIVDVIEAFAGAAKAACDAGFDGVELHAAHGYLISQFMSPRLNTREDEYANPLLVIEQIIARIRAITPAHFVLGIKLNAGDYVTGGLSKEKALEHVRQIALLGVDFIEISGGDYENPSFLAAASPRQAFFSSFSRQVVRNLPTSGSKAGPLIVLTGALRTPSQLSKVIRHKHAHLLGIGRLSVYCPDLPRQISPASVSQGEYDGTRFPPPEPRLASLPRWFPSLMGAGVETAWYVVGMRRLARRDEAGIDVRLGSLGAVFWMWAWAGPGRETKGGAEMGPGGLGDIVAWVVSVVGVILTLVLIVSVG